MRMIILLIGVAAGLLALSVFFGWAVRSPALVQVLPGASSMVLSTAALFLLSGATLGMIGEKQARRVAQGLSLTVCVLAAAVLVEHFSGVPLGIDLPRLHAWINDGNPTPGRTSVSSAYAFLLFGAGSFLLATRQGSWRFAVPELCGWAMLFLATFNLLGYLLRLEDLFVVLQVNRMAPHTSAGAVALAAGLLLAVRLHRARAQAQPSPATRILVLAVALMVGTSTLVGTAVLALLARNLERTTSALLLNSLEGRRVLASSLLELRQSEAELVGAHPALLAALEAGDAKAARGALEGFLGVDFAGLRLTDARGRELASVGSFSRSFDRSVVLDLPGAPELATIAGEARMRARVPIHRGGVLRGHLQTEQPMPVLTRMIAGEGSYGMTGETALCYPQAGRLACFPTRLTPRPFEAALENADGSRLPMAAAVERRTGVVRTRDYRGRNVIAAYGPVGYTGLGMVVKADTAELFAPAREQLLLVALAMLALIAGGAVLLRRRVHPLAQELAHAEEASQLARNQMQMIADNVPALVGYMDRDWRYRFVNRTYEAWFGRAPETLLGRRLEEAWDSARVEESRPYVARALAGERVEFGRAVHGTGGTRHLVTTYVPDVARDGAVRGFFILSNDVTDQVEARRAVGRAMQKLDFALDASRVAVWETDLRTGETVLSDAWAEMLRRARAETRTSADELAALVHPEDVERVRGEVASVLKGDKAEYVVEHRVRAESGHWIWILSRGKVMERDPGGRALTLMGTNLDITERKRSELQMEKLANYDTLTGCANRNLFSDRLRQAIARCARSKGRAALMYLDIDKFKGINDTLGHDAGDALLKEFAARLKAAVRATDTVGRLGGDEFAILLEEVKEEDAPARVAQKVLEAMRAPVDAVGKPVVVTTSIGVALFGGEAEPEALAKRADVALYEAKAAGRNTYRVGS